MPRLRVKVENNGLKDLIKDFKTVAKQHPQMVKDSFDATQKVIEDQVRSNWISVVGGTSGDRIYKSIGRNTEQEGSDAFGTVGVFKIDAVEAEFGKDKPVKVTLRDGTVKTREPLTAAQIAYWIENGTHRLASGARMAKGGNYSSDVLEFLNDKIVYTPAKPFISKAYYDTIKQQNQKFSLQDVHQ